MDEAGKIASHAMAAGEVERTLAYVERGRRYAGYSDEHLEQLFVLSYEKWAREIDNKAAGQVAHDVDAEYALRSQQPPYERVKAAIDVIAATLAHRLEALSDQERERINTDMVDDYLADKARQN